MSRNPVLFVVWLTVAISVPSCNEPKLETFPHLTAARPDPNDLALVLSLDDSLYTTDEAILATLFLINVGDDNVLVNNRMALNHAFAPSGLRDVVFVVTDPEGRELDLGVYINTRDIRLDDFIVLMPKGVADVMYDLNREYSFVVPGPYTIQGIYENQLDPENGAIAWKGEIKSNIVTITVEP